MKTVLLLGGPAAGQRVECHGNMGGVWVKDTSYHLTPMCSHGEVHWFGVLEKGADPLALLIAGYKGHAALIQSGEKSVNQVRSELYGTPPAPPAPEARRIRDDQDPRKVPR